MSCSKCNKCDGSGLIPLKRKDGSVISHSFIYCECREDEPEHYQTHPPEDFDFPMSYNFRSFVEEQSTGQPLPALVPMLREVLPVLSQPESAWSKGQWDYIQQLKAMVSHLNSKVTELRAKEKGSEY